MTRLILSIPGPARGKARPRVVQGHAYTPDPGGWVELIKYSAFQEWGRPMWEGPVGMAIEVTRAMPKGWSRKKLDRMLYAPCEAPADAPNIAAAVADALEHIAYANDRQIASISCLKVWGHQHKTVIELWRMGVEGTPYNGSKTP